MVRFQADRVVVRFQHPLAEVSSGLSDFRSVYSDFISFGYWKIRLKRFDANISTEKC